MNRIAILAVVASGLAIASCAPKTAPADEMTILEPGSGAQCKVEDWQPYVGKPRISLPTAPNGLTFRVLCSTCVATMDYRPDRVTFTYDDKDVISRASCG
jgi:hypothetical protein